MKKFLFFHFIFIVFLHINSESHPWKPDHYVIIDTDCGLDDFRAINLMLASSNIRVLAIITSNGVVNATDGYQKVKSLLKQNYKEGILIGANTNPEQIARNCDAAVKFPWTDKMLNDQTSPAVYSDILNKVFMNCSEKVIFINLGGLNTINSYLKENPQKRENIKELLWTCNNESYKESFNYLLDTAAYNMLNAKGINFDYIDGSSFGMYSNDLMKDLESHNSILAKKISRSLTFSESPFTKYMYDESVLFYLLNKQVFSSRSISGHNEFELKEGLDISPYYIGFIDDYAETQNQVLSVFPLDTADYFSDIQCIMEQALKKYGKEEWKACVLASELHRHLGAYSLIGAKMGIRAKEYFGAGDDELKIVSYAGLNPPFSCLNDGLQVSTGATLGHGLISVDETNKLPVAEFSYLGQKIRISLKDEFCKKIATEIKDLSIIYGLDSNVYWDLVRSLAIKYWANWDRHDIFEIETK